MTAPGLYVTEDGFPDAVRQAAGRETNSNVKYRIGMIELTICCGTSARLQHYLITGHRPLHRNLEHVPSTQTRRPNLMLSAFYRWQ